MLVLWVDPGYAIVGYGIIEGSRYSLKPRAVDFGAIVTSSESRFEVRLRDIYRSLNQIFLENRFDIMSIESLFFQNNQKTAMKVSQAMGVMLLVAAEHNVPIFEYTPLQIKTSLTGSAKAPKAQIMQVVKKVLSLKKCPKLDDTADALALAVCCLRSPDAKLRSNFLKLNKNQNVLLD